MFKDDHLEPLYLIYFGKFKYPLVGPQIQRNSPIKREFVYQYWRAITNHYLFFFYQYRGEDRVAVFDRANGKPLFNGNIVNSENPRYYDDLTLGIWNDIDGGRNISTITQFMFGNGNELIKSSEALDLIESMRTKKEGELNPQFTQKRKAFMEMAKKLKEDDNPVIQIFHLKN